MSSDDTLDGLGTVADQLSVANAVPDGGESGEFLAKRSAADGDFEWDHPLPAAGTHGQVLTKDGNATDYAVSWADLEVNTDGTITGSGTTADPLGVANPFTDAEEQKLDGIAAGAEANVQADWDETDTASDAYVKNKPGNPSAADISVDTATFNNNLSPDDDTVQRTPKHLSLIHI